MQLDVKCVCLIYRFFSRQTTLTYLAKERSMLHLKTKIKCQEEFRTNGIGLGVQPWIYFFYKRLHLRRMRHSKVFLATCKSLKEEGYDFSNIGNNRFSKCNTSLAAFCCSLVLYCLLRSSECRIRYFYFVIFILDSKTRGDVA